MCVTLVVWVVVVEGEASAVSGFVPTTVITGFVVSTTLTVLVTSTAAFPLESATLYVTV